MDVTIIETSGLGDRSFLWIQLDFHKLHVVPVNGVINLVHIAHSIVNLGS